MIIKPKNEYYVYQHRDLDDNIFYVGKGKNERCYTTHKRTKEWKDFIGDNEYLVDIVFDDLTEEEALDAEACLILHLYKKHKLVNKVMTIPKENYEYYKILQNAKDMSFLYNLKWNDIKKDKFMKDQFMLIAFLDELKESYKHLL